MKNEDAPAFPQPEQLDGEWADPKTCKDLVPFRGLTKRELFAAMAMQGAMAQPDERRCPKERLSDIEGWRAEVRAGDAEDWINTADALLLALSKPEAAK